MGPSGLSNESFDIKKAISAIQSQVNMLCQNLKRKEPESQGREPVSSHKKQKIDSADEDIFDIDNEPETFLQSPNKMAPESDIELVNNETEYLNSEEQSLFDNSVAELNLGTKIGASIQPQVAKLVSNILKFIFYKLIWDNLILPMTDLKAQKIQILNCDSKLKALYEKYAQPSNIDLLQVTQVNKLIWDNLILPTRMTDLKAQKIQVSIVKAMTALTAMLNEILNSKAGLDKETILRSLTDALALLGTANINFNFLRRELIKPEMKNEYKSLCSKTTPLTTLLFGDNVKQQMRDITDASKVSKRCLKDRDRGRGNFPNVLRRKGRGRAYDRGVQHGPLFYRYLEIDKIKALTINRGNYDGLVSVSKEALEELNLWNLNLSSAFKPISAQTRTRARTEQVNGQLKNKFRCLLGDGMQIAPPRACDIIVACCVLFNISKDLNEPHLDPQNDQEVQHEADEMVVAAADVHGVALRADIIANFFT
ncbi:hypothetical protein HOLleu_01538 [Holothuria leucospilota]|uniref:DDE Tnp4 domain-containing protein n=1 Tax=Holothuria leucospilota TaxID=206669 RepID=A0A9Q1HGH6_HOLLE|nr:hypothetical protein HOLleu_01538 [Holothuria leucospilota]